MLNVNTRLASLQLQSLDDARLVTSYYLSPEMFLAYRMMLFLWTLAIFITCLFTILQLGSFGASLYFNLTYFTILSWYGIVRISFSFHCTHFRFLPSVNALRASS